MKIAISASVVASALALLTPGWTPASARDVNRAEATELLWAAVDAHFPEAKKLPGLGFDGGESPDKWYPHFNFTQVTWAGSPEGGSCVVGFIALDPKTADVWDGNVCEEIKSPRLTKLQQRIRTRMGLSEKQYRKIRASGPECE
jgi:hypothetical protein